MLTKSSREKLFGKNWSDFGWKKSLSDAIDMQKRFARQKSINKIQLCTKQNMRPECILSLLTDEWFRGPFKKCHGGAAHIEYEKKVFAISSHFYGILPLFAGHFLLAQYGKEFPNFSAAAAAKWASKKQNMVKCHTVRYALCRQDGQQRQQPATKGDFKLKLGFGISSRVQVISGRALVPFLCSRDLCVCVVSFFYLISL